MIEQMLAQPWSAHVPICPRGLTYALAHRVRRAPYIDVVVRYPTRQIVGLLRRASASIAQSRNEVEERFSAFAQIARLRRPIIHLNINVRRPIRTPRRRHRPVPDTLQVCRLRPRPGTAD